MAEDNGTESGSALKRLRAHIEQEVVDGLAKAESYRGHDWCGLTECEEQVFGLTLRDMPRLTAVWEAWDILIGRLDAPLADDPKLANQLAAELPLVREGREIFRTADPYADKGRENWREFAALFDVPFYQSVAFMAKVNFYEHRTGLVEYKDGKTFGPETHDPNEDIPF